MIDEVLNTIGLDQPWAWSLIGLGALVVGLVIREICMHELLTDLKTGNKQLYKKTLKHYQQRSLSGWVFFAFYAGGAILLWLFKSKAVEILNFWVWIGLLGSALVLSILCHLRAYAQALVHTIRNDILPKKDLRE